MLTLQQITYFVRLADELHYTKAAEKLHVAQPSLSYAINKMEDELGVSLFVKNGKKLNLTQYGEAFLPYARSALDSISFGLDRIESLRKPAGAISIGYIYSVSYKFFPALINRFTKEDENSNVTFHFTLGVKDALVKGLEDGSLDFAIAGSYEVPGLQKARLLSQDLVIVMPKNHPLASRGALSLQELKNEKFVFPKKSNGLREILDRHFAREGIIPHIVYEADECNALTTFASTGAGITIVPPMPTYRSGVSVHKMVKPVIRHEVALLWSSRRALSPIAEKFKEFVISQDWENV